MAGAIFGLLTILVDGERLTLAKLVDRGLFFGLVMWAVNLGIRLWELHGAPGSR